MFQDACDLQTQFIRKREELCKDVLVSTARLHNESLFGEELAKLRKQKRAQEKAQEEAAEDGETTPAKFPPGGEASAPSSSTTTPEKPSNAEKPPSEVTQLLHVVHIPTMLFRAARNSSLSK